MDVRWIYSLNAWHFVWIAVIISEVFTALMNMLNSYIWYGKLKPDLLMIGSIDALFVSFFVSLIVIHFLRNTRRLEELNRLLQEQVSEKTHMETALRESEIRYRTLFEKAGDAIFILEAEGPDSGQIVDANRSAAHMHGYSPLELSRLHIRDLDCPLAAKEIPLRMRRLLSGEWVQEEILHRRRDGTLFPVEINAGLLEINGHKYILAIDRDISIRKGAEKALRESENKYRTIFENAHEGIWVIDLEGRTVLANPQLAAMLGYKPSDLLGREVEEFVWHEDLPVFQSRLKSREKEEPSHYDLSFRKKDGSRLWALVNTTPVHDSDGKVSGAFGMVTDISPRKKMEDALRESEERYRKIFESAPYSIAVTRMDNGLFLQVNESFTRITGYTREEVLGKTTYEMGIFLDPEKRNILIQRVREKGVVEDVPMQYRVKGGRIFNALLAACPIHFGGLECLLTIVRDVTEEKQVQQEKEELSKLLRQAQKMEAVGTLAGGIAHDFNNILTAIIGYTELALLDLPREARTCRDLGRVIQASQRAKELVGQILSFSRNQDPELKPVSIVSLVKESVKLIRAIIPSSIEIVLDIEKDMGMVVGDTVQIQQVIINLCTNGAQAIAGEGILKIALSRIYLAEPKKAAYTELAPGSYALLSIEDSGTGMDEVLLERIFDPYFTTKEKGQGTGLGLSTVLGIVKGHKGGVVVRSRAGHGSTFSVFLPISERNEAVLPLTPLVLTSSGRERILLVDDEEALIELGGKILEKLGYRVTLKSNGQEALDCFRDSRQCFDLVITDQTMPKMLGTNLIKELRKIHPDIPVILCTGYSELDAEELGMDLGIQGFIKKPYRHLELARTVQKALRSSKPALLRHPGSSNG